MSNIIPHVARAITAARIDWQERDATDGEPSSTVISRAAIRATVEYLQKNISHGMREAAADTWHPVTSIGKNSELTFVAMLSQAIKELEQE